MSINKSSWNTRSVLLKILRLFLYKQQKFSSRNIRSACTFRNITSVPLYIYRSSSWNTRSVPIEAQHLSFCKYHEQSCNVSSLSHNVRASLKILFEISSHLVAANTSFLKSTAELSFSFKGTFVIQLEGGRMKKFAPDIILQDKKLSPQDKFCCRFFCLSSNFCCWCYTASRELKNTFYRKYHKLESLSSNSMFMIFPWICISY